LQQGDAVDLDLFAAFVSGGICALVSAIGYS
jgi:hypothetical protein